MKHYFGLALVGGINHISGFVASPGMAYLEGKDSDEQPKSSISLRMKVGLPDPDGLRRGKVPWSSEDFFSPGSSCWKGAWTSLYTFFSKASHH